MGIKVNGKVYKELDEILKKIKQKRKVLHLIGNYYVSKTQKKIKSNIPPPNAIITEKVKRGDKTLRDTGQLINSINYRVISNSAVKIGTPLKYAPVQQYGAIIRPRSAKKIAFPASAYARRQMQEADGTIRGAIERMKKQGWHIWFTEGAIMGKKKKDDKNYVLFIRKDEVKIPARPFLIVEKKDFTEIKKILIRWLKI